MSRKLTPEFGKEYGLLYPLIWRILSLNRFFSISPWLPSSLTVDLYILVWWCIELSISWKGPSSIIACTFLAYRLIDLFFIQSSMFLKGYFRTPRRWATGNRIVLLTVLSAIEIMLIFGLLFMGLEVLLPQQAAFDPKLSNLFTAVYVSFVTGTTLGYGTPHPIGWISQSLAVFESCFILLIMVMLIGAIRGGFRPPISNERKND